MSRADYPAAQFFRPPHKCERCGKPAGELISYRNSFLAYLCERHANAAIKDAHKLGNFLPDVVSQGKT